MARRAEKGRSEKAMVLEFFRISRADSTRLREFAAQQGRPYTAVARDAVCRFLDQQQVAPGKQSA